MKAEQQRIAIAEACGIVSRDQWGPLYKTALGVVRVCPDYLTDLNAMHEAEKVMGYDDRLNYPAQLFDVVCRTSGEWQKVFNKIHPDAWALQASAAQRAEAFLRTIGKWENDK
jgi:hypothetical protein